jgi:proteasome accessory factor B
MGRAVVDTALFQAVSKAVLDCEEVAFDYQKLHRAGPESRRVQPYHFASVTGMWYLVGFDLDRRAMRTFALPRIRNLKRTGRHFRRDPGFTPRRYFGDSLGVLRGGETVVVRIAFDSYAAAFVRERVWHDSQMLTKKDDGGLEVEMRLSLPEEAMRWALSWGEHARVLAPTEMVERVRTSVRLMGIAYGC